MSEVNHSQGPWQIMSTSQKPRASNWSIPPEALKEYEELKAKSSGSIIFVYKPIFEDKPDVLEFPKQRERVNDKAQ